MSVVLSILLLSLLPPQSPSWQLADRAVDQLRDRVRVIRIEDERAPESRPKGSTGERRLEKIVSYDSSGRVSEEIEFSSYPAGCVRARRIYSYDQRGDRKETLLWGKGLEGDASQPAGDNVRISRQSFKWDGDRRWAEIADQDSTGATYSKTIYKFDDDNRVLEVLQSYGGSPPSTCRFKYNDQGLASEEICERAVSDAVETTSYTYETDSRGNWVKRIASLSAVIRGKKVNQGARIAYRQIEYFSTDSNPERAAPAFDPSQAMPCPTLIVRKSGGVFEQSAIKRVKPDYPRDAIEKAVSGTVVVEASTDENGKVVSVRTISGPQELRRVAEEAVKQWEFKPTVLSKMPARVVGTITFKFN